jgi:hypothetical protein
MHRQHSTAHIGMPGQEQLSKHSTAPDFGHGSNPPPDFGSHDGMSVLVPWCMGHGRQMQQVQWCMPMAGSFREQEKGQVQDILVLTFSLF